MNKPKREYICMSGEEYILLFSKPTEKKGKKKIYFLLTLSVTFIVFIILILLLYP